jgi:putative membrane protein
MGETIQGILSALGTGLPTLILHFAIAGALLAAGVTLYNLITPFNERRLIADGNTAAGIVFAGVLIGLAIPLGTSLAYSAATLDVLVWGAVAVILQLVAYVVAASFLGNLRRMIEGGNVAAAYWLAGIQISVALLNAGAMAG